MNHEAVKSGIMARINAASHGEQTLPDVPFYSWPGDPVENFIKRLIGFDGRAIKFRAREDALAWLLTQPELDREKRVIYSRAAGVPGNFGEEDLADPHNAHRVETCVTEGELAVGETCSIWVTDRSLGLAACALLARRLFIFQDSSKIVSGLHEAYAKIDLRSQQYGCFFSGPSATADIEAVHLTGAQGSLALTALLYNCADAADKPQLIVNPHADHSVWQESM